MMKISSLNYRRAWEKSFTEKRYRVGLHVLFWIVYFSLFKTASILMVSEMKVDTHLLDMYSLVNLLIGDPMLCIIFYLTIRTAYKHIIYKKKYGRGILYLLLCIVIYINLLYLTSNMVISIVKWLGYPVTNDPDSFIAYANMDYIAYIKDPMILIQAGFSYFVYMFLPVFCKFFRDQLRLQRKQAKLEKQNVQLEMNFLKSQIHPHFLFNTLNNIYSLITHQETKKSAEMVAGLSSLLRYALYDAKTEFILLEKEISMLKDFIELEEVRSDNTLLTVKFPAEIPDMKIPSFLLLPLVENAFKHGVNAQLKQSCVKVEMQISKDELLLRVQNTFDPEYRKRNVGGLGIANLEKRLNYYYEDRYLLNTEEKDHVFTASLKLPLSCPISNA